MTEQQAPVLNDREQLHRALDKLIDEADRQNRKVAILPATEIEAKYREPRRHRRNRQPCAYIFQAETEVSVSSFKREHWGGVAHLEDPDCGYRPRWNASLIVAVPTDTLEFPKPPEECKDPADMTFEELTDHIPRPEPGYRCQGAKCGFFQPNTQTFRLDLIEDGEIEAPHLGDCLSPEMREGRVPVPTAIQQPCPCFQEAKAAG